MKNKYKRREEIHCQSAAVRTLSVEVRASALNCPSLEKEKHYNLYELNDDAGRKAFLDELFDFMQKRDKWRLQCCLLSLADELATSGSSYAFRTVCTDQDRPSPLIIKKKLKNSGKKRKEKWALSV
ncbi:hypothetical protein OUZ56_003063 [Daphnia magna]|uniref:Uncharacterized protein n=1 Tax=Daphnia magna TaxID=35525 RepID=A0ABR0A7N9_9CRUS|nr:hypothetical protein OUZ56_003063 [Daphnia magna]